MKGLLFEYYSLIGDTIVCNKVNERSRCYLAKVNKAVSKESYEIRENQLRLIEKFQKDMAND